MEVTGICRFNNISNLKIYTIFRLCGMGLLPCKDPNVYLGPVSFFFTLFHNHRQHFSSWPENWILAGTSVTSESQLWQGASWTLLVPPHDWARARLASRMLCMAEKAVLKTAKGQGARTSRGGSVVSHVCFSESLPPVCTLDQQHAKRFWIDPHPKPFQVDNSSLSQGSVP